MDTKIDADRYRYMAVEDIDGLFKEGFKVTSCTVKW